MLPYPARFILSAAAALSSAAAAPLQINEIVARNSTGFEDGFGDREDWIEIHNPNAAAESLAGWHLTDSSGLLTKWTFPAGASVPGGGHLLVFASGKDITEPGGRHHTNFSLSGGGEYLALVRPDGTTIEDEFAPAFPEQFTDIAYGRPGDSGAPAFFESATPGATNGAPAFPGVVKDTDFSVDRGFYDTAFQLEILSATPGAVIRYTTDGSAPSATAGLLYTGPLDITTTATVRAVATFSNWLPTNVDTQTYIFVDDVVEQPAQPPGVPNNWRFDSQVGQTVSADYEMDQRVVDNTNGLGVYTVQEALLDIPSVSIVLAPDDFLGNSTSIYDNSRLRGAAYEKVCSMEYIRPDGGEGFQEDCKVEMHGNSSRTPFRMQKHSFRITFDSTIGPAKLRFPLFPQSDVETFNKLVLRACFTDSWALNTWDTDRYRPNDSLYMRDVWMKDTQRAMGHAAGTGDFVHLYVNGLYWGLHDLTERYEDDWYADHLGGEREHWEINADFRTAGPLWNAMISTLNGAIETDAVYETAKGQIDIDNYIDYALLHMFIDAEDLLAGNGYAGVNAVSGDGRWRFQVWDQELALDEYKWYSPNPTEALSRGSDRYLNAQGGMRPFQRLRRNDEFLMRFADRVHLHLFNGGALALEQCRARFLSVSNEIDKAIVAESARWGDTQAGTVGYGNTAGSTNDPFGDFYPPAINTGNDIYFTREQHWLVERDFVVNDYLPIIYDASDQRGILNEMRANGLYPSLDPPAFGQHGGLVPSGFTLPITSSEGTIYVTTDGSDPRLEGGAVNPAATALAGGTITETFVDFEDTWAYLDTGADLGPSSALVDSSNWRHPGFDDSGWATGQGMFGYGGITGGNIITPVEQRPAGSNTRHLTHYLRHTFQLVGTAAAFTDFAISIKHDDGAVVYINGKEIARSNMPGGVIAFDTPAVLSLVSAAESAENLFTSTVGPGDLVEGTNVIAVEAHNQSTGSSDFGIDVQVTATRPNSAASGVNLTQTGTVNARALEGGEWSALTSAEFIVGTAADASNLVVSEIYYNPPGADESTEWLELMNISGGPVDLTSVSLVGIDYTFPTGSVLSAGQRIVLVKDQAAFAAVYPTAGITIAPGNFTSSLNNGGEEIAVISADGITDLQRFTYEDRPPWPTAPDGDGYSLVLIAPGSNPDHAIGSNWRSSVAPGGSPGQSDAVAFVGDPDLDDDDDGMSAFLEHALGSIGGDNAFSPESFLVAGTGSFDDGLGATDQYLTVTHRRNLAADDALIEIQVATDLAAWTTIGTALVATTPNGDGTETVTYRSTTISSDIPREFIRLLATSR